ncbi:MAG: ATP-binding cassette domain-containing protein [Alphaproteobacteria bacterium]|nr:ATP-binding cassette domain-containing protein [Alphaproteobacteria bacterium]
MSQERKEPRPLVEFDDVSFRYFEHQEILKDVNFKLHRGEFVFLTGPSGAGKTSFLNLMHLNLMPTSGTVKLFGRNIERLTPKDSAAARRKIGAVFQDFRLLPHLTVLENIALPLRISGKSDRYIATHVPELVEWVGLKNRMQSLPDTLSGGEKQRVAIARAVIGNPDLIIADEPTGSVDDEMAGKLLYLFKELNKMGTAVIIATHSKLLPAQFGYPVYSLGGGIMTKVGA